MFRGTVVYIHHEIQIQVSIPHRDIENIYSGVLTIREEPLGPIVEWTPKEIIESIQRQMSSPDSETLEWEDISIGTSVSYKIKNNSFAEDNGNKSCLGKKPNIIVFEVMDLKSYRYAETSKNNKIQITFFLKDGSTIPTFQFPPKENECFLSALNKYVAFRQSSKDDSLFVVIDPSVEALEKSFSELHLFGEHSSDLVMKFFQDPYSATLGGFSKVTNFLFDYLLPNGNQPSGCSVEEVAELLHESIPSVEFNEPGFEVISCIELPPRPKVQRSEPVSQEEWLSHIDSEGKINNVPALKRKIFQGGLTNSIRSDVWKFLLGYYSFNSTQKERHSHRKQKENDYYRMKLQWKSITPDQEARFSSLRDRKNLVEKDVSRTDRNHPFFKGENNSNIQMLYDILMTYCMYNFDLGYVQGMSDLLSPILYIMKNEADSFWCFAGLLERMGVNFEMDQQGMKTQLQHLYTLLHFATPQLAEYLESHESGNLYFCFRWLLILFKREFKFHDIMHLWEVLWTDLPCKNFHLLICMAILDKEKDTLMENEFGLTEILKHINDMAYNINLEETLCCAEGIYLQLSQCKQLTQSVQDILDIHVSSPPESENTVVIPGSKVIPPSSLAAGDGPIQPLIHSSNQGKPNTSPPSGSSSIEVLSDDVDLESKYQLAVDLNT